MRTKLSLADNEREGSEMPAEGKVGSESPYRTAEMAPRSHLFIRHAQMCDEGSVLAGNSLTGLGLMAGFV